MTTATANSLSRASSAYLRSAMHQPIQWHEWGPEAFEKAKAENKPILLDIGAVWCHWCHVMDRESYDNPDIAQLVNERFIAIKVDRDERPDIDVRYQAAVSAVSGQGGWPLTAFLLPDGVPFYGGTYFPPDDQYGRPSFKRVLTSISDAYREKHADVTEQAQMVKNAIAQAETLNGKNEKFSSSIIDSIVKSALKMFDDRYGGFGNAPKFPHPAVLDLLIDQYARSGDENLREAFVITLEKMARGGVYDQLAGGFHRYSVDERWIVPHFEKMSYDNSELLKNYVHAYQVTGTPFFADVARDIIRWIDEWLSDRDHGGFYASQDADYSMDDDGDYFTWSVQETDQVLSSDEASVAKLHYDINEVGEMHHNIEKNVLYVRGSLEEISQRLKLPLNRVEELLRSAKQKMYAARLQRPTPFIDKTVYVSWNALCISAYLEAAKALALDSARHFALRSLDRTLAEGWNAGELRHVIAYSEKSQTQTEAPGLLEDYAFTTVACLDAYEATSDITYFNFARRIGESMIEKFFDEAGGGFFDTSRTATSEKSFGVLSTPRKPFQDSPTPAGNSVAAIALSRLYGYTSENRFSECAQRTMEVLGGIAAQYGIFAATYAIAGIQFLQPHIQIAIVGNDGKAESLYRVAIKNFAFGKSVIRIDPGKAVAANLPPALAETIPNLPQVKSGESAAIICSNFSCQSPISDPAALADACANLSHK
jgi:uncharacterized protein YyaL (SSP411 family)